jgi:tRNA(Glu) U13 pseudouridine synthase TruD
MMGKRLKLSDNALLASFKIAELIVKKNKAHNIGKELILSACKEIVEVILGSEAAEQVSKAPLSKDTVHRRITEMSTDMENNFLGKLQANKKFPIQPHKSTDVSGKDQ